MWNGTGEVAGDKQASNADDRQCILTETTRMIWARWYTAELSADRSKIGVEVGTYTSSHSFSRALLAINNNSFRGATSESPVQSAGVI